MATSQPFSSATFVYDGDGKRVKSVVNGTITTYFVGNYYEVSGSTVTKYHYAGTQRIALRSNGVVNYLLGDHLGSTSLTTSATGTVISDLRYKAWGEVRYASGTCAAPGNYAAKWDFTYDGDGVRTAQSYTPYTNGAPGAAVITRYYFGGAYETTGSTWKKYYAFAGQTIAMRDSSSSGFKYFLTDYLGSISVVLDGNGTILEQQRYLPFGQPRVMPPYASVTSTDFTYTGQRDITGSGLMDYKARFFSSLLGRFIQPDSLIPNAANPQNLNRMSYANNNSLRYTDPTGHRACDDVDAAGNCITAPGGGGGCGLDCLRKPQRTTGKNYEAEKHFPPAGNQIQINIIAGITLPATGHNGKPATVGLLYYSFSIVSDYKGRFQLYLSSKDQTYIPGSGTQMGGYASGPAEQYSPSAAFGLGLTASWGMIDGIEFRKQGPQAFAGPFINHFLGVGEGSADVYYAVDKNTRRATPEQLIGVDVGYSVGIPVSMGTIATNSVPINEEPVQIPPILVPVCQWVGMCGSSRMLLP
jgi:RHS repeat-associated protein